MMAFTSNICSKRQLWPMNPPQIHLSSYITGGLKRLYHHLRSDCLNVPIYEQGQFTNDKGHFHLNGSCVMASRYRILHVISTTGQSAVLLRAEDMFREDEIVVIKVLHTTFSQLGVQETHCLQQIKSVDPDDISHTLRLLNIFTFGGHFCMVFEALHPDPINKIFQNIPRHKLMSSIRKVALRLLTVLGFLQRENVIHADLKPDNILLKKKDDLGSLKVIDFGNAIHHVHKEVSLYYEDFELQTPLYRAPEVIFGIPFGSEIDMWSVGCILAELYAGKPLFYGTDENSILEKMTEILGLLPVHTFQRGKFYSRLKIYTGNSSQNNVCEILMKHLGCRDYNFCLFLSACLQFNPDKRLRPKEAALHPFLAPELPLAFLLSTEKEKVYPTVYVPKYSHSPRVSTDIQRSQPSSLDLLRLGTSSVDTETSYSNVRCSVTKLNQFECTVGNKEELKNRKYRGRSRKMSEEQTNKKNRGRKTEWSEEKINRGRSIESSEEQTNRQYGDRSIEMLGEQTNRHNRDRRTEWSKEQTNRQYGGSSIEMSGEQTNRQNRDRRTEWSEEQINRQYGGSSIEMSGEQTNRQNRDRRTESSDEHTNKQYGGRRTDWSEEQTNKQNRDRRTEWSEEQTNRQYEGTSREMSGEQTNRQNRDRRTEWSEEKTNGGRSRELPEEQINRQNRDRRTDLSEEQTNRQNRDGRTDSYEEKTNRQNRDGRTDSYEEKTNRQNRDRRTDSYEEQTNKQNRDGRTDSYEEKTNRQNRDRRTDSSEEQTNKQYGGKRTEWSEEKTNRQPRKISTELLNNHDSLYNPDRHVAIQPKPNIKSLNLNMSNSKSVLKREESLSSTSSRDLPFIKNQNVRKRIKKKHNATKKAFRAEDQRICQGKNNHEQKNMKLDVEEDFKLKKISPGINIDSQELFIDDNLRMKIGENAYSDRKPPESSVQTDIIQMELKRQKFIQNSKKEENKLTDKTDLSVLTVTSEEYGTQHKEELEYVYDDDDVGKLDWKTCIKDNKGSTYDLKTSEKKTILQSRKRFSTCSDRMKQKRRKHLIQTSPNLSKIIGNEKMEDNFYLCHSDGYESGPEQKRKILSDQSGIAKIEKGNNYDEFTACCADQSDAGYRTSYIKSEDGTRDRPILNKAKYTLQAENENLKVHDGQQLTGINMLNRRNKGCKEEKMSEHHAAINIKKLSNDMDSNNRKDKNGPVNEHKNELTKPATKISNNRNICNKNEQGRLLSSKTVFDNTSNRDSGSDCNQHIHEPESELSEPDMISVNRDINVVRHGIEKGMHVYKNARKQLLYPGALKPRKYKFFISKDERNKNMKECEVSKYKVNSKPLLKDPRGLFELTVTPDKKIALVNSQMTGPYVFKPTPDTKIALMNSQRKQRRLQNKPANQNEEEFKAKGKLSEIPRKSDNISSTSVFVDKTLDVFNLVNETLSPVNKLLMFTPTETKHNKAIFNSFGNQGTMRNGEKKQCSVYVSDSNARSANRFFKESSLSPSPNFRQSRVISLGQPKEKCRKSVFTVKQSDQSLTEIDKSDLFHTTEVKNGNTLCNIRNESPYSQSNLGKHIGHLSGASLSPVSKSSSRKCSPRNSQYTSLDHNHSERKGKFPYSTLRNDRYLDMDSPGSNVMSPADDSVSLLSCDESSDETAKSDEEVMLLTI